MPAHTKTFTTTITIDDALNWYDNVEFDVEDAVEYLRDEIHAWCRELRKASL